MEIMTTVAQVREVVQPLLQRNPDLALVGRLVVIKPVHHILRGIYIDRSLDSQLFIPTWAVTFLFEPSESFSYNWGGRLYNRAHGAWVVTNPATSAVMCEEIEKEALPLLRPIQTIDDFIRFTSKDRFRKRIWSFTRNAKYLSTLHAAISMRREQYAHILLLTAQGSGIQVEWRKYTTGSRKRSVHSLPLVTGWASCSYCEIGKRVLSNI
jgi:hypothetical protein